MDFRALVTARDRDEFAFRAPEQHEKLMVRRIARQQDRVVEIGTPQAADEIAMHKMTVHGVLAGAYRGKRANLSALLTHASTDGGSTSVCGSPAEGNLCDEEVSGPPTCKKCSRRYQ